MLGQTKRGCRYIYKSVILYLLDRPDVQRRMEYCQFCGNFKCCYHRKSWHYMGIDPFNRRRKW